MASPALSKAGCTTVLGKPQNVLRAATRRPLTSSPPHPVRRASTRASFLKEALNTMGNLVSFSTPKSEVSSFHALSALDIDKKTVEFDSLSGKVSSGAGGMGAAHFALA